MSVEGRGGFLHVSHRTRPLIRNGTVKSSGTTFGCGFAFLWIFHVLAWSDLKIAAGLEWVQRCTETTPKRRSVWFNDLWFSKHIVNSHIVKVNALMCGFIVSLRKISDVEATFSIFSVFYNGWKLLHLWCRVKNQISRIPWSISCSDKNSLPNEKSTGSWVIKQDGCWQTCLVWRMQSLRLSSVNVISCVWAEGFWRFMRRCFLRGFFSQLCGMWGFQA